MAALVGFDSFVGAAAVLPPITLGANLVSVTLPAQTTVGGLDLDVSDLDGNAVPVVRLDVGDAADADRYVASSVVAQGGGLVEYRPANSAWFRYAVESALRVTVQTAPATSAAGSIALVVYGYPSVDVSAVVRATLQQMGVLAEGETARAEDASLALEALAEVHEVLRGKQLANRQDMAWPLAAVPMFALRPYAAMAGNLLADTFGVSTQRAQRLAARAVDGEREMRRQTRKAYSGQPVSLEPYREPGPLLTDYGVIT